MNAACLDVSFDSSLYSTIIMVMVIVALNMYHGVQGEEWNN